MDGITSENVLVVVLHKLFQNIYGKLDKKETEKVVKLYLRTLGKYNNRPYHNMSHVLNCLLEFYLVKDYITNPTEMELAIFFHDVIYNKVFLANYNEERSFLYIHKFLTKINKEPKIDLESLYKLIIATKIGELPKSTDCSFMQDIDKAILGYSYPKFAQYRKDIRKEYWFIPNSIFAKKEKAFLVSLLQYKPIYNTSFFRKRYEDSALTNIWRYLEYA